MATKAIETAGSLDQATLDALREGIAAVLVEQSSSAAVHAFIDGENSLDRELWSQAASLDWPRLRHFGAVRRPRTGRPRPRHPAHRDWTRRPRPGPSIATLSGAQAGPLKAALTATPGIRGCRASRPVKSARRSRATPGRAVLNTIRRGVSSTLRCLGARDAAFVSRSPWRRRNLHRRATAGAEVNAMHRCGTGPGRWRSTFASRTPRPAAVLEDPEATSVALLRAMALATAADSCGAARSVTERTIAYAEDARAVRTTDRRVPGA